MRGTFTVRPIALCSDLSNSLILVGVPSPPGAVANTAMDPNIERLGQLEQRLDLEFRGRGEGHFDPVVRRIRRAGSIRKWRR